MLHPTFEFHYPHLLGNSLIMDDLKKKLTTIAHSESAVLIEGGSGTGKEILARALHHLSKRSQMPFISIHCATLSKNLFDHELFGSEFGSSSSYIGRLELAHKGTIFLNCMDEMPFETQLKLKKMIKEKIFIPVGGKDPRACDVRLIAATQNKLEDVVYKIFQEDEASITPLKMPALSERMEDIPILIESFLKNFPNAWVEGFVILPETLALFMQYPWPGNVHELMQLIEKLVLLYPGQEITPNKLPSPYLEYFKKTNPYSEKIIETHVLASETFNLKNYLNELEATYIQQALQESQGVVTRAAKKLGLRRTTLIEKMRKYQIVKKLSN